MKLSVKEFISLSHGNLNMVCTSSLKSFHGYLSLFSVEPVDQAKSPEEIVQKSKQTVSIPCLYNMLGGRVF